MDREVLGSLSLSFFLRSLNKSNHLQFAGKCGSHETKRKKTKHLESRQDFDGLDTTEFPQGYVLK